MEQQVREETVELNQNARSDNHPNGGNDWSRRQILQKIFHEGFS
jgi:hypothetical protein